MHYNKCLQTILLTNKQTQNGQITDPPAYSDPSTPKASRNQYAHQPTRGRSPDLTSQQSTIFCRTCTQNQHFYTQSLASYLPDSTDPEYKTYVAKLDEYKTNLEKRYPQICAECAPKVNQRMRETNKAARDDHLRRKLLQSKVRKLVDWEKWSWKRIAVFVGGLAWGMSLLSQLEHHALGMLPSAEVQEDTTYGTLFSTQQCIWKGLRTKQSHHSCLHATRERALSCFWLGLLSCWWNYKLAEALYSNARLRGVNNHMALQVIVLLVRAAALWGLDQNWLKDSALPMNAAHGVMLIFLLLVSPRSIRSKKFQTKTPVDHHNFPPFRPAYQSPPRLLLRPQTHRRRAIINSQTSLFREYACHIRLPNFLFRSSTYSRINVQHLKLRLR